MRQLPGLPALRRRDRVAHQHRYHHLQNSEYERAANRSRIPGPVAADVGEQAFHLATPKLSGIGHKESVYRGGGASAGVEALEALLVDLRVLEEDVERRRHCGVQTAPAVAEAATHDVEIEKTPQRVGEHPHC